MIVVRIAQPGDVDTLYDLAQRAGPGMTTLKPERDSIAARLERVQRTLHDQARLAEQGYLFVMEALASGQAVGCCGIESAVGLEMPFYTYRLATVVHASRELDVWTKMPTLYLSHDLTGYSELCSLFLLPDYRHHGNGSLLSKSRFMFIADFRERFPQRICAEMRGYFDEQGRSPFWEALGRHFFAMDFERADRLVSLGKKSFIAELMPRHPVYVDFLPEKVRQCLGKTHPDTVPARKLLEEEGLRFEHHVDIFEAGPVLECHVDDLRACRDSALFVVLSGEDGDGLPAPPPDYWLVANRQLADYRVIIVPRPPGNGHFRLTAAESAALRLAEGATVRALPLHPGSHRSSLPRSA